MDIVMIEKAIESYRKTQEQTLPRIEHAKLMENIDSFVIDRRENLRQAKNIIDAVGQRNIRPRILDITRVIEDHLSKLEGTPRSENPNDVRVVINLMIEVNSLSFGLNIYMSALRSSGAR